MKLLLLCVVDIKSAPDAPGRIPNIRPAAKQLFRAKSYCSTPTLHYSWESTCRWHQCTSILTRLKPANSIPTIMQSIILVAPFAMDRQVNIQAVEKPRRRLMRQSSGGCVRGAKSPPRVQSNRILKLFWKFQNPHSVAKRLFRHAVFNLCFAFIAYRTV